MSYKQNYAMYSRAPQGWHDEPFEYVWSFQAGLVAGPITASQLSVFNNPLQFDPDADFYLRGIAALVDLAPPFEAEAPPNVNVLFDMRLRDCFGRALDSGFIPMAAYATSPSDLNPAAAFFQVPGSPVATPWYPELYCPANGAMWADFNAEISIVAGAFWFYSFHLYFQGIKRFQNESCEPSSATTTKQQRGVAA